MKTPTNNTQNRAAFTWLAILTLFTPAAMKTVAAEAADKAGYHLLNPTPKALMREMRTDRPDKTESPYTVDAGHLQIELDAFTFTHGRDTSNGANTVTESWAFAPINLKIGLCNEMDLQVIVETWNKARTHDRDTGTVTRQSGFGDMTARLKINLWGNDGGKTAFGLMPFVKIPTNQNGLGNNGVEGGIIFPLAVALPGGWDMGVMTEFDYIRNGGNSGYHSEFINSITFSHGIIGELGGYAEFFSAISTERHTTWVGSLDFGLTYGLTKNIQLDAGVNIGVTKSAPDWNPFVGFSVRF